MNVCKLYENNSDCFRKTNITQHVTSRDTSLLAGCEVLLLLSVSCAGGASASAGLGIFVGLKKLMMIMTHHDEEHNREISWGIE